jgi:hypothetical protein
MVDLLLIIQVVTWVFVTFLFMVSRTSSLFHPFTIYTAFHGIVFVLRPLLIVHAEFSFTFSYMRFTPTEETFATTLAVTNIAFCVFAVVSWWAGHRVPKFEPQPGELTPLQRQALIITFVLLAPLALYSAFVNAAPRGFEGVTAAGAIAMDTDPATGFTTMTNTTGYILDAQGMLATMAVIFIWLMRFRWWSFAPLVLFLGYRAFLGWGRYAMVMSLASLLLVYLFHTRRRWIRAKHLLIAIPLLLIFQQLGEQRDYVRELVTGERPYTWSEFDIERGWLESQDTLDFANFEFLTAIVESVPQRSATYTYFTQYLQLFTEPIPRMLWAEKPVGAPIKLVNMNDHVNFIGLTHSLVGDGWLSFGWFGVIVTFAVVGYFLGRLHFKVWRNTTSHRMVLAYCTFIPLTLQWFRDGGISIATFSAWVLMPLILWWVIEKVLALIYSERPLPSAGPLAGQPDGSGARTVLRALTGRFAAPPPQA